MSKTACFTDERTFWHTGGTHALYVVMQTLLDEGDEVIAIAPYYTYYKDQVEMARGKLVVYNAPSEKKFDVALDELEKHITARTKAIIVISSNWVASAMNSCNAA